MTERVLLVGAGNMGVHYTRVLTALGYQPEVVCRSAETAKEFRNQTGFPACSGGLSAYLAKNGALPERAIVAVDVDQLASVTEELVRNGAKEILLEKPGALNLEELE